MKLAEIHLLLVQIRKERKVSQQDIADSLNVEQATISMYENGKRGIPLDLLDHWLQILEIEFTVTPKDCAPVKPVEDIQNDLVKFNNLKKRRNYLLAELRALAAEKLMNVPELKGTNADTGEPLFWPYSFHTDEKVGLVETRYDHPEQKYLAVEYTCSEVNVYKFMANHEASDGEGDREWLDINRIYFSEDDFLTFGSQWEKDSMDMRKITILRENKNHPDGIEIVETEGFPIRSLLEMQGNFIHISKALKELEAQETYSVMESELDITKDLMLNILLDNRLKNGAADPQFAFWSAEDIKTIDIPLGDTMRNWAWVAEGVEWVDHSCPANLIPAEEENPVAIK